MRSYTRSPEVNFLYLLLDTCLENYLRKVQSEFSLHQELDEQTLIDLIQGHRLEGIIFKSHNFSDKLSNFYRSLYKMHKANTLAVTKMLSEMETMTALLNQHSIAHLYMKGPLLSQMLYNSPSIRGQGDIDLLIKVEDLPNTIRLLRDTGWTSGHPSRSIQDLLSKSIRMPYTFFFDEFPLRKNGLDLDLHWRVAQGRSGFISTENLLSNSSITRIGKIALPSMSQEFLPLLCGHTAYWDDFLELRQHLDFRLSHARFHNNGIAKLGKFRELYEYSGNMISSVWIGRAFTSHQTLSTKSRNHLYRIEYLIQNPQLAQKRKFGGSITIKLLSKLRYGSQLEILLYLLYRLTLRSLIKGLTLIARPQNRASR